MLAELKIENVAVIEKAEVQFTPGLNVLTGETGAGKTTTALAILRLLPERTGCINQGQILFEGCDLLTLSEEEMRTQIRGEKISMIFQDPMTSLNPVATVRPRHAFGPRLNLSRPMCGSRWKNAAMVPRMTCCCTARSARTEKAAAVLTVCPLPPAWCGIFPPGC